MDDDTKIKFIDISKPLLELWKGGDGDPFQTLELDRESRKYIHVRVNNIVKTYGLDGMMTAKDNYYPVVQCKSSFFTKPFEQKYLESQQN